MTNHNPWPGLPLGTAGRADDKEGPSTNNPNFEERLARDAREVTRPAEGFAPITPPRPVPVPPPVAPPADPPPVPWFVAVKEDAPLRYALTLGPLETTCPQNPADAAAVATAADARDWHRERVWRAVEAAVAGFYADGPGRRFRDARSRSRASAAEAERLRVELAGVEDGWRRAVADGDAGEEARFEAERETASRAAVRAATRLDVHREAVEQARREAEAAVGGVIAAARAAFLAPAEERERAARDRLLAAVRGAFDEWFAAHTEAQAARTAGTGAAPILSQRPRWERLHRID